MEQNHLQALSPLDGRYTRITQPLATVFSESSLISYRVQLELKYFQALSQAKVIRPLSKKELLFCKTLEIPTLDSIERIKHIEQETHHDVKAVEYYLAEAFQTSSLKDCVPFLHIGLTSEDINNLAYRMMIQQAQNTILIPQLKTCLTVLADLAHQYCDLPMLARTHGQAAIPTTLGKELSVFAIRLLGPLRKLENHQITGKLNGAVGSLQALHFCKPDVDWLKFSQDFVASLGLQPNLHTTQINPPEDIIELFNMYHLINSIFIDLNQDCWRYISDNWLIQTGKDNDVGSSTMPQKINPIEFENSEGNLTLANGLIETIARKLPISRLQRDLSDSTINRNFGSIFGYCLIGYTSLQKGLQSVTANRTKIEQDLNENFSILSEALQTHLRFYNEPEAYQKIALLVKNKVMTQIDWQAATKQIAPKLSALTPQTYVGLAVKLTRLAIAEINHYLTGKA